MQVDIGNTVKTRGKEEPYYNSPGYKPTKFDKLCEEFQIRIEGPGCGLHGLLMFGARAVGNLIVMDDPVCGKIAWKITLEERNG